MIRIYFFLPFLFMMLVGCAYLGQDISQSERALLISQQYQSLENTYKSQYNVANEEEKEWLRNEVAPILDIARLCLIRYNQFVLEGESNEAADQRLELIRLLRKANSELMKE